MDTRGDAEIEALRARVAELEAAVSRVTSSRPPARELWGDDQLAEREELLREVERIANVGGWAWDMRSGRVAWSDELFRILGLSRDGGPATFERFIEAVHPDDRAAVQALAARASEGDVAARADYRVVRPGGTIRDVVGIAQIFRDDAGLPHRMVGVALDVTERKQLEDRLAQSQKLEALGRLAGGVAHDFNNYLTVILLNLASLRGNAGDDDERLVSAHEAATRAAELTGQLLAFSRHSVRRAVPVDVNQTVEATLQLVAPLLDKRIRVDFVPHRGRTVVEADATQLSQVILNLAMNARDAMPEGGLLSITTHVEIRPDRRVGSFVRLDVGDTGTGMSDATRSRLFEPFFTTKQPGKGTGLGLATVFGIVAQSDGFLEVDSVEGQGSRFSVFLPALLA